MHNVMSHGVFPWSKLQVGVDADKRRRGGGAEGGGRVHLMGKEGGGKGRGNRIWYSAVPIFTEKPSPKEAPPMSTSVPLQSECCECSVEAFSGTTQQACRVYWARKNSIGIPGASRMLQGYHI